MTTQTRVSDFRGKPTARKNADGKPQEGTKLRDLYDRLRSGSVVAVGNGGAVRQLVDFYGMELATVKEGRRIVGKRLLGEWEGPYYVPIERIVAGMAGEA